MSLHPSTPERNEHELRLTMRYDPKHRLGVPQACRNEVRSEGVLRGDEEEGEEEKEREQAADEQERPSPWPEHRCMLCTPIWSVDEEQKDEQDPCSPD